LSEGLMLGRWRRHPPHTPGGSDSRRSDVREWWHPALRPSAEWRVLAGSEKRCNRDLVLSLYNRRVIDNPSRLLPSPWDFMSRVRGFGPRSGRLEVVERRVKTVWHASLSNEGGGKSVLS
jgi:hypothetical protein